MAARPSELRGTEPGSRSERIIFHLSFFIYHFSLIPTCLNVIEGISRNTQ
jgi:hypothetical protein